MTGSESKSTARPWWPGLRSLFEPALVVVTVAALVLGGIAWLIGWRAVADGCWVAGTLAAVVPALVWVVVSLRRGRAGWICSRCCRWWARCWWVSMWPAR